MKLLCRLGIHRWRVSPSAPGFEWFDYGDGPMQFQQCQWCDRVRIRKVAA